MAVLGARYYQYRNYKSSPISYTGHLRVPQTHLCGCALAGLLHIIYFLIFKLKLRNLKNTMERCGMCHQVNPTLGISDRNHSAKVFLFHLLKTFEVAFSLPRQTTTNTKTAIHSISRLIFVSNFASQYISPALTSSESSLAMSS